MWMISQSSQARNIYYLTGFDKRLLVVTEWAWSYLTFARGARLITGRDWHLTE